MIKDAAPVGNKRIVTFELQEHFAVLYKRQKMLEETGIPKGPVTRSEWVKKLKEEHKIIVRKDLIERLTPPGPEVTQRLPLPAQAHYLITKRGEEPKDKATKGMGTREMFGDILLTWNVPGRTQDVHSTAVQTLGTHKPDHLMRKAGRSGEQSIVTAGEIKRMLKGEIAHGDFSDEEVGQELDFLQMAFILQPWRTFIYGFLTDTRRFEFFRAVRECLQGGIHFERSEVHTDEAGWVALQTLLSQSDEALGFQDISVRDWEFVSWLGSGATSVVFGIINIADQSAAVCKIYISHTDGDGVGVDRRAREVRALNLLSDQPNVPCPVVGAPVQTVSGLSVLIKKPVGLPIPNQMRLPVSAYAPLVATLKIAHGRDLYHNDVSPSCFFAMNGADGSSWILLNDWGSAASAAEIANNSDNIGTRLLYYNAFGAAADLSALVRSIFYLTQATFNCSDATTCAELDAIMRAQLPLWREALVLAGNEDYDGLAALLGR